MLPVWLLLAPRDYLSTFLKIGTILLLAVGIILVRPDLQMPAMTQFIDGTGPVWAGEPVPVPVHHHRLRRGVGLHALISSGTTPKMIENESQIRLIGYGGMLMESFVAIMAMIAATRDPSWRLLRHEQRAGLIGTDADARGAGDPSWGFTVTPTC